MRERPRRIAVKVKAIREHFGVSQAGMKRLLNFKGGYERISEFEVGKRQPSIIVLLAYARAARVPLEEIVDDDLELTI